MNKEIQNIVNKVLFEEMSDRTQNIRKRILEHPMRPEINEEETCECGGIMKEGECMECGSMKENEMEEGNAFGNAVRNAKMKNKKFFNFKGKRYPVKESAVYYLTLNEGQRFKFNENEMVDIIENIVLEEKKKKKSKTKKTNNKNITKDVLSKSKKENDDYIDSVVKKMKDYLKGGSKGKYEMDPTDFPKGNGELAKMEKHAYIPSDIAKEYIDNFTAAGLENLYYDEIHPNDEWVEKNIVGSSETGNNPDWANAVKTDVGDQRNKIRKNNLLSKAKRMAYQKDDQPIKIDRSGNKSGDEIEKLFSKYGMVESKESKKVISDIDEIKDLMNYNKKTQ